MKIGQISYSNVSTKADYLQLDICGLDVNNSIKRYLNYNTKLPVILHADWSKKGINENSFINVKRRKQYINIAYELSKITTVKGLTLHPPFKSKISLDNFLLLIDDFIKEICCPVFIENRSNKSNLISSVDEITKVSNNYFMTIDIPQLYITCNYDTNSLIKNFTKFNINNIKEIHIANLKRIGSKSYVGRKLNDGNIEMNGILKVMPFNAYVTLEILGGVAVFENEKQFIESNMIYK